MSGMNIAGKAYIAPQMLGANSSVIRNDNRNTQKPLPLTGSVKKESTTTGWPTNPDETVDDNKVANEIAKFFMNRGMDLGQFGALTFRSQV